MNKHSLEFIPFDYTVLRHYLIKTKNLVKETNLLFLLKKIFFYLKKVKIYTFFFENLQADGKKISRS